MALEERPEFPESLRADLVPFLSHWRSGLKTPGRDNRIRIPRGQFVRVAQCMVSLRTNQRAGQHSSPATNGARITSGECDFPGGAKSLVEDLCVMIVIMQPLKRYLVLLLISAGLIQFGNEATGTETSTRNLTLFVAEIPGYMGGPDDKPGILVEMAKLAGAKTRYRIEQKIVPWARALKIGISMDNALLPGLSKIPSRERDYAWIVRQMEVESAFVTMDQRIDSFELAKNPRSIGVHRGTSHEIELENKVFLNLHSFKHIENAIKMLEKGWIDSWYGDINELSRRWR
ncbi:MAG: hypothetical protein CL569_16840 [Alphaproteobacteria bacterium]|nr:hypothetical protein [Alphaproteobacteria bacterium]